MHIFQDLYDINIIYAKAANCKLCMHTIFNAARLIIKAVKLFFFNETQLMPDKQGRPLAASANSHLYHDRVLYMGLRAYG
jgi:hypothetical protein